jgi:hypothetical protein
MRHGHFAGDRITCEKFARRIVHQSGEFFPRFAQGGNLRYPNGTSVMFLSENIESEIHDRSGGGSAIQVSRCRADGNCDLDPAV